MSLVLQLHLVMMGRYSMVDVDTSNAFRVWSTLKFLHDNSGDEDKNDDNDDNLAIKKLFFFETDKLKLCFLLP